MKVHLAYPDRDLAAPETDPPGEFADVVADLELQTLWKAMAGDDEFLHQGVRSVMAEPLATPEQVRYRQHVLADCLAEPDVVRALYDVAVRVIAARKKIYRSFFSDHGESLLRWAVEVMQLFLAALHQLRTLAEEHADRFTSAGFRRFFADVRAELADDYLAEIEEHLRQLRFGAGIVLSARLGAGNQGVEHVLRSPRPENRGRWYSRSLVRRPSYGFTIPPRDEGGFQALTALRDHGLDQVAEALTGAVDHVQDYFLALQRELAFYLGAVNLHAALTGLGVPVCFPETAAAGDRALRAEELCDPCLALQMRRRVVGNDLDADGRSLIVVTGANQGGKSTLLRSIGVAHLMLQCGLFVAAGTFTSSLTTGVFTHHKREEDRSMTSGKFDEELARMSDIADRIRPGGLLLCNESFAATNEREGSDIAAEVIRAMTDAGIRVVLVTHMYDLAHRYEDEHAATTLFLRADRDEHGGRSYRLRVAPPLPTSYGEDLYAATFADPLAGSPAGGESG